MSLPCTPESAAEENAFQISEGSDDSMQNLDISNQFEDLALESGKEEAIGDELFKFETTLPATPSSESDEIVDMSVRSPPQTAIADDTNESKPSDSNSGDGGNAGDNDDDGNDDVNDGVSKDLKGAFQLVPIDPSPNHNHRTHHQPTHTSDTHLSAHRHHHSHHNNSNTNHNQSNNPWVNKSATLKPLIISLAQTSEDAFIAHSLGHFEETRPTDTEIKGRRLILSVIDSIVVNYMRDQLSFSHPNLTTERDPKTGKTLFRCWDPSGNLKDTKECPTAMLFGSVASGLDMRGSDMDIAIPANVNKPIVDVFLDRGVAKNVLFSISERLEELNHDEKSPVRFEIEEVLSAKVPILKLIETKATKNMNIDVAMNSNQNAVITLINHYCSLDPRVRPFIVTIKHWAKQRNVADAMQNWPNTFGYVLLCIKFLQEVSPPVLPVVGLEPHSCHLRLVRPLGEELNTQNLFTLIVQFFEVYHRFDFRLLQVSITRAGLEGKGEFNFGLQIYKKVQRTMMVEDPAKPGANVTRNVRKYTLELLQNEMYRGYKCAINGDWKLLMLKFHTYDQMDIRDIYPDSDTDYFMEHKFSNGDSDGNGTPAISTLDPQPFGIVDEFYSHHPHSNDTHNIIRKKKRIPQFDRVNNYSIPKENAPVRESAHIFDDYYRFDAPKYDRNAPQTPPSSDDGGNSHTHTHDHSHAVVHKNRLNYSPMRPVFQRIAQHSDLISEQHFDLIVKNVDFYKNTVSDLLKRLRIPFTYYCNVSLCFILRFTVSFLNQMYCNQLNVNRASAKKNSDPFILSCDLIMDSFQNVLKGSEEMINMELTTLQHKSKTTDKARAADVQKLLQKASARQHMILILIALVNSDDCWQQFLSLHCHRNDIHQNSCLIPPQFHKFVIDIVSQSYNGQPYSEANSTLFSNPSASKVTFDDYKNNTAIIYLYYLAMLVNNAFWRSLPLEALQKDTEIKTRLLQSQQTDAESGKKSGSDSEMVALPDSDLQLSVNKYICNRQWIETHVNSALSALRLGGVATIEVLKIMRLFYAQQLKTYQPRHTNGSTRNRQRQKLNFKSKSKPKSKSKSNKKSKSKKPTPAVTHSYRPKNPPPANNP